MNFSSVTPSFSPILSIDTDAVVNLLLEFVDDIENNLDTSQFPNVDLLIRTGGEKRISNFLIWQLAYSELYFVDKLWPDFNEGIFIDALYFFQNRERRFGVL